MIFSKKLMNLGRKYGEGWLAYKLTHQLIAPKAR